MVDSFVDPSEMLLLLILSHPQFAFETNHDNTQHFTFGNCIYIYNHIL